MNDALEGNLPVSEAALELQRLFDRGDYTPGVNLTTRLGACEKPMGGEDEVCSHEAIFQIAIVNTCETCKHKAKEVKLRRCLLHALSMVERYVDAQTSLFGTDDGDVAADRVVHAHDGDEAAAKIAAQAPSDIVVDGTTGKVHTEFVEDPDAPGMCACGWMLESTAPRSSHDHRHLEWRKKTGRYVEGETAPVADVTAAQAKRAKERAAT